MEQVMRCPLCASPDKERFDARVSMGERIENWICRGCGLVFLSPRRTAEELAAFYERGYRTMAQGSEEPTTAKLGFEDERAEQQVAIFRANTTSVGDFLEIGCAAGRLM